MNPILPSGKNHIHFDHRLENHISFTLSEAARALTALNVFCVLGGSGYQPSISSSIGSVPVYSMVIGNNLFETLVFGMLPVETENFNENSVPIWRRNGKLGNEYLHAKLPLLFGLTYPARTVRIFETDGIVDRVFCSPGLKYSKERTIWNDPYVSYRFNASNGRYEALCCDEKRDQWRDIGVLFDCLKKTSNGDPHYPTAPSVICQYLEYERPLVHVHTYTMLNDQATYKKMSKEEYVFSSAILKDAIRFEFLVNVGLKEIENEGNHLYKDIHKVHNAVLKIKHESAESRKLKSPAIDSEHVRTMERYYFAARKEFFEYLYPKLKEASISDRARLQNDWGVIIEKIRMEEYNKFLDRVSDSSYLLLIAEKSRYD